MEVIFNRVLLSKKKRNVDTINKRQFVTVFEDTPPIMQEVIKSQFGKDLKVPMIEKTPNVINLKER